MAQPALVDWPGAFPSQFVVEAWPENDPVLLEIEQFGEVWRVIWLVVAAL